MQRILDAIPVLAAKLARLPTRSEFISCTGISEYYITRFFPSWHDAVRAAGLQPRILKSPVKNSELLNDWGEVARKIRALPSRRAYRREGKFDLRTLERRFGRWSRIPQAFADFAKKKPEWADVVAFISAASSLAKPTRRQSARFPPQVSGFPQKAPLKERITYGNPINFCSLRHEPVNEQGVVLLFGMLAKELGYTIEAVQNGFPDCEAKRQIGPNRWQRVLIEFEFESRNFRDHGHPTDGCDVIVCWRHNWPDCPPHIEVVELCSVIQSLGSR